jgi:hypothetical protein
VSEKRKKNSKVVKVFKIGGRKFKTLNSIALAYDVSVQEVQKWIDKRETNKKETIVIMRRPA